MLRDQINKIKEDNKFKTQIVDEKGKRVRLIEE